MLLFHNNVIVDCFIKMSPQNIIWGMREIITLTMKELKTVNILILNKKEEAIDVN